MSLNVDEHSFAKKRLTAKLSAQNKLRVLLFTRNPDSDAVRPNIPGMRLVVNDRMTSMAVPFL